MPLGVDTKSCGGGGGTGSGIVASQRRRTGQTCVCQRGSIGTLVPSRPQLQTGKESARCMRRDLRALCKRSSLLERRNPRGSTVESVSYTCTTASFRDKTGFAGDDRNPRAGAASTAS